MRRLPLPLAALLAWGLAPAVAGAAEVANSGEAPFSETLPFVLTEIAEMDSPWALAFLPDGRALVTEHGGELFLLRPTGEKLEVSGVPPVAHGGQNGLFHVAPSPRFAQTGEIYFTFSEPGEGGSGPALARAKLVEAEGAARLEDLAVLWRQEPKGGGGHPGAIIAFDPSGEHLFLTVGDRQRMAPAQDPDQGLGKILRLTLDGAAAPGNPQEAAGGVRAMTWTTGHRNPYGLAFAPDGRLWSHEMGPQGGDELNLIEAGANYGWPEVSYGVHYGGRAIPKPPTRTELHEPALYWTPVIAPAGLTFYAGDLFPDWRGSALIGALAGSGIVRVAFDDQGGARQVDRWDLETRIRDVETAPDGSVWAIEDGSPGRVWRLTPAG
ncbi:PQQ-dependent sugar dehydrogenase [Neomegalonema sp.]|uniref:PQQ-dependent sugar dehydrogenase n=1 Tax=Neomegalonema sp. TaxID=2039713 RepID=UPI0026215342|nr:PQQ-dependent sugar dehydrogenase [Neomegalonema sp.]MDD2868243.1 PQQ-dependent sugar dehydrogenase [Neomegalonema sp.]